MPSQLITKREELSAKRHELGAIFAEAGDDMDLSKVKLVEGDTPTKAKEIRRRNDELTALGKEVDELAELDDIAAKTKAAEDATEKRRGMFPSGKKEGGDEGAPPAVLTKSIGQLFVESDAFKEYDRTQKRGPSVELNLEEHFGESVAEGGVVKAMDAWSTKATLDTATGYAPQAIRIPVIITPGEMQGRIAALLASGSTSSNAIPYMEETTTTNAAAETAEGGAKPESTLAFTEKSSTVRKIATFLPVTDELFDDVPAMRSYVENRLRTFIAQREDGQLLNGNGTAPNLRGILNVVGIQTQAKGADPTPDAVYKAMTKVAVGAFLDADAFVTHHNDWQEVRLLRTADGIYIWGSPSEAGPERIWGLNVTKTTRIAEGTGLVGAFREAAQVFRRSEIAFAVSDSHSDFFQKNLLALRVEERLALVVFRPAGFCTVTGI
jgi:HK97 family phage major capsid protein